MFLFLHFIISLVPVTRVWSIDYRSRHPGQMKYPALHLEHNVSCSQISWGHSFCKIFDLRKYCNLVAIYHMREWQLAAHFYLAFDQVAAKKQESIVHCCWFEIAVFAVTQCPHSPQELHLDVVISLSICWDLHSEIISCWIELEFH